jgi:hypothetical protein
MSSEQTIDGPEDARPERAAEIEVRTTRYDMPYLRGAQLMIPIALIVNPIAKRSMSPIAIGLAFSLMGGALWCLIRFRIKANGSFSVRGDRIKLGEGERIRRDDLEGWRWQGNRAMLYLFTGNVLVKARHRADATSLEMGLRAVFGAPREFVPRGSLKARWLSVGISLLGIAVCIAGIVREIPALMFGVVLVLGGFGAFGALSQRIAAPAPTRGAKVPRKKKL